MTTALPLPASLLIMFLFSQYIFKGCLCVEVVWNSFCFSVNIPDLYEECV